MSNLRTKEMDQWLSSLGLNSEESVWTLGFTLSTTEIENWFYRRNKLKPEDVKIELIAPSAGTWVIQLERKDRLYVAQWRKENDFRVESQQMKYRRLVKWPELNSLYDFPKLINPIEDALNIKFIRHVDVGSRMIDLKPHLNTDSKLFYWLKDCSETIGTAMKTQ